MASLPARRRIWKSGSATPIGTTRRACAAGCSRYLGRCSGSLFADVPDPHSDGISPHQFHWMSEDAERFVGFRFHFAEAEAPCVAEGSPATGYGLAPAARK